MNISSIGGSMSKSHQDIAFSCLLYHVTHAVPIMDRTTVIASSFFAERCISEVKTGSFCLLDAFPSFLSRKQRPKPARIVTTIEMHFCLRDTYSVTF